MGFDLVIVLDILISIVGPMALGVGLGLLILKYKIRQAKGNIDTFNTSA